MNCTGKRCIAQYNKVDPATCTAVPYCPQATPPKTNADRIRSMTDAELAEWFGMSERMCPDGFSETIDCDACPEVCMGHWLLWLKEDVKDGET